MLSYIVASDNSTVIKEICKQQNILILHELQEYIDLDKYIKETKINYNLLKFLIIDLECISNTDDEIITILYNFSKLYKRIRIILIVQNYELRLDFLNNLVRNEFYNFIIINDQIQIKSELLKCLSQEGKVKKDVQSFEIIQEVKQKKNRFKNIKLKIVEKLKKDKSKKKEMVIAEEYQVVGKKNTGVYFFELLLEAGTRLIRLIGYILMFLLTSLAITILLNPNLREIVFKILKGEI